MPLYLRLTCVLIAASSVRPVAAQEDFTAVYGKASPAVVLIDFQDHAREVGSGVIVGITPSGSALILTASHVVEGYEQVLVSFAGGVEPQPARVSPDFYSEEEDMAIVVADHPPEGVQVISFRKSPGKKGESVGTIGHPLGEAFTWSNGTITYIQGKYIVHDARLERGSSGGPLLDDCGRFLGMNIQLIESAPDSVSEAAEGGTSVATSAASIVSTLDGWFADTRFAKKWKYKKYCSFWERLYKQPIVMVGEGVAIAAGVVALVSGGGGEPQFGEPPAPPSGQ